MIHIFSSFLVLILLAGCNSGSSLKQVEPSKGPVNVQDTLYGELLPTPLLSKTPIAIYYSPYGLIAVPGFQNEVIQLIDTVSGKVLVSQFSRGKGPDELLNPLGMDYNPLNSTFCIWDLGKQSVNLYRVSSSGFQLVNSMNYKGRKPSLIRNLNDSLNVILSSIPNQSLLIYGETGITASVSYRILSDPNLDYFNNYYPSEIDCAPEEKIIFTADPYLPFIAAYSFQGNDIVKLWDKMVFTPEYSIKNGWRYIHEESCLGFDCISVSEEFIYVTYFGVNRKQWDHDMHKNLESVFLLVFNFDGELVKEYILDQNLDYFTVSPDDRLIYGLIEKPDRYIVKYKLK